MTDPSPDPNTIASSGFCSSFSQSVKKRTLLSQDSRAVTPTPFPVSTNSYVLHRPKKCNTFVGGASEIFGLPVLGGS